MYSGSESSHGSALNFRRALRGVASSGHAGREDLNVVGASRKAIASPASLVQDTYRVPQSLPNAQLDEAFAETVRSHAGQAIVDAHLQSLGWFTAQGSLGRRTASLGSLGCLGSLLRGGLPLCSLVAQPKAESANVFVREATLKIRWQRYQILWKHADRAGPIG